VGVLSKILGFLLRDGGASPTPTLHLEKQFVSSCFSDLHNAPSLAVVHSLSSGIRSLICLLNVLPSKTDFVKPLQLVIGIESAGRFSSFHSC